MNRSEAVKAALPVRHTPDVSDMVGAAATAPAPTRDGGRSLPTTGGPGRRHATAYDLFISHASEDKDAVARPLAQELAARGLRVWYDEYELKLGDSLRRSIDRGLASSRFGVVVLSPNFFAKEWPQRELDGLTALEIRGRKVILPVWHDVTRAGVLRHSPVLADRLAARTSQGVPAVADAIEAVVRADPGGGGPTGASEDAKGPVRAVRRWARANANGLLVGIIGSLIAAAIWALPSVSALLQPTPAPTATAAPGVSPPPARSTGTLPAPPIVTVAPGRLGSYGKQHAVVRQASGRLSVFFGNEEGRQLVYATSTDQGRTWTAPVPIGQPALNFQEPSAAVDRADAIHLIWGGWQSEEVYYSRSDDRGWSPPAPAGFGAFGRNTAVDSANRPWVVWSSRDVWLTMLDRGTWSNPSIVQSGAWHPDIAVDSRDHVHVVYNSGAFYPDPGVRPFHLAFDGRAWSAPEQLSSGPFWTGAASLAIDAADRLHVVFLSSTTREGGQDVVNYVRFVNGTWQRPVLIGDLAESGGQTGKEAPCIGVDRNGVVYVAWRGRNQQGKRAIFVTALRSDGWTPVQEIENRDASEVAWPSMGTNIRSGAGVDLVWEATIGRDQLIQYTHVEIPQSRP